MRVRVRAFVSARASTIAHGWMQPARGQAFGPVQNIDTGTYFCTINSAVIANETVDGQHSRGGSWSLSRAGDNQEIDHGNGEWRQQYHSSAGNAAICRQRRIRHCDHSLAPAWTPTCPVSQLPGLDRVASAAVSALASSCTAPHGRPSMTTPSSTFAMNP